MITDEWTISDKFIEKTTHRNLRTNLCSKYFGCKRSHSKRDKGASQSFLLLILMQGRQH
jgi:hypothetical protein